MHEEFWETREDRRTDIELFQIWVNFLVVWKFNLPLVTYIGSGTEDPWIERTESDGVVVIRDVGATLDNAIMSNHVQEGAESMARARPPVGIFHTKIQPNCRWKVPILPEHSAVLYVREGTATLLHQLYTILKSLQTATFSPNGDTIIIGNTSGKVLDVRWKNRWYRLDLLR